ncbi:queuine tRNA-ribosyltransferase [Plasmodium vinckei petteri]|uniref:Queuine tRNA-ribosyltransferase n=1 Tax=Plasmodium vinckei petteri TaxID=138298 RepID=W7ACU2_PLAVN|nr:queuine tRNA-ribosyltransferase [Plasmodium vinckei petteri]CAD2100124.1 queuine tRNA-ribosyltransferase, putative [Plasmodium vinckei petteri]
MENGQINENDIQNKVTQKKKKQKMNNFTTVENETSLKKIKKNIEESNTNISYEEPLPFDFLTENDYKEYESFANFFEDQFSKINIKDINNKINEMKNEGNSYFSNYLNSSDESDGERMEKGDQRDSVFKQTKEYNKNLKLINIKKNKRARLNIIVIKKKYIDNNSTVEEKGKEIKKNTIIISPLFMPVGTKCCIKGLIEEEVKQICNYIILSNTYHVSNIYDMTIFQKNKDINNFIRFPNSMLTDSGGFQMVSLSKRIKILEEGILFNNIYDSSIIKRNMELLLKDETDCDQTTESAEKNKDIDLNEGEDILLTPEKSIKLQNMIGSDIIMALDDVRPATESDINKIEEATYRTNRWLERCIKSHGKKEDQTLFGIIQGGLHIDLRNKSMDFILRKKLNGYAIGGLCGGEKKKKFIEIINHCSNENNLKYNYLPINKCRYIMGIGYLMDILFCSILGYDMYDCVYPSRTARFNTALSYDGTLKLKQAKYKYDFTPLVKNCSCYVCNNYSKSFLHLLITKKNPVVNTLLTIHNIFFTLHFCYLMRVSIFSNKIDYFVTTALYNNFVIGYKNGNYKIPDSNMADSDSSPVNNDPINICSNNTVVKETNGISENYDYSADNLKNEFSTQKNDKINELIERLPIWALEALKYANIELKF